MSKQYYCDRCFSKIKLNTTIKWKEFLLGSPSALLENITIEHEYDLCEACEKSLVEFLHENRCCENCKDYRKINGCIVPRKKIKNKNGKLTCNKWSANNE